MSHLPLRSTPHNSFNFCSDRTSAWKRSTAVRIRSEVDAMRLKTHSDLVPLQELLTNNHPLDLRGSLTNQQQGCVPVEALDLILLRVAVAAVYAEALLDALLAR